MHDASTASSRPPLIDVIPAAGRLLQRTVETLGVSRQVEAIVEAHPALAGVNQRLAAYLPAAITRPYSRETLLACALRDAVTASGRSGASTQDYLEALLARATMVLRYNLVGEGGRWDPLYDPPLMVWLRANPPPESPRPTDEPWTPLPVDAFVRGLFDRLVPDGALPSPYRVLERA